MLFIDIHWYSLYIPIVLAMISPVISHVPASLIWDVHRGGCGCTHQLSFGMARDTPTSMWFIGFSYGFSGKKRILSLTRLFLLPSRTTRWWPLFVPLVNMSRKPEKSKPWLSASNIRKCPIFLPNLHTAQLQWSDPSQRCQRLVPVGLLCWFSSFHHDFGKSHPPAHWEEVMKEKNPAKHRIKKKAQTFGGSGVQHRRHRKIRDLAHPSTQFTWWECSNWGGDSQIWPMRMCEPQVLCYYCYHHKAVGQSSDLFQMVFPSFMSFTFSITEGTRSLHHRIRDLQRSSEAPSRQPYLSRFHSWREPWPDPWNDRLVLQLQTQKPMRNRSITLARLGRPNVQVEMNIGQNSQNLSQNWRIQLWSTKSRFLASCSPGSDPSPRIAWNAEKDLVHQLLPGALDHK